MVHGRGGSYDSATEYHERAASILTRGSILEHHTGSGYLL